MPRLPPAFSLMGIRLRDQGFKDLYDEHRLCLLVVKLIWNPENMDAGRCYGYDCQCFMCLFSLMPERVAKSSGFTDACMIG